MVLVHFAVVRSLFCDLPVFEKEEAVAFFSTLLFLANFFFLGFDSWPKVELVKSLFGKKKLCLYPPPFFGRWLHR